MKPAFGFFIIQIRRHGV